MSDNTVSPFTLYRMGYEAGYHGLEAAHPSDSDYMTGFIDGNEDDQLGNPNRYGSDIIPMAIRPIRVEEIDL